MTAILGATGNIGARLANQLLDQGRPVRVMARSADNLVALKKRGAEVVVGDLNQTQALHKLFAGAEAAFVMIPPAVTHEDFLGYQKEASEKLVAALAASSVKYVVNLSSLGAHRNTYVGPVRGLHDHEIRLQALTGVNVLNLRPTFFMENLLGNIGMIKEMKINGGAIKAGVKFPAIATKDIADEATARLLALDFKGHSHQNLLGPEDVDMTGITKVFAEAMGLGELPYVEFSYGDFKQALLGFGLSNSFSDMMVELNDGLNRGVFQEKAQRDARSTTSTTFREFLKGHKSLF